MLSGSEGRAGAARTASLPTGRARSVGVWGRERVHAPALLLPPSVDGSPVEVRGPGRWVTQSINLSLLGTEYSKEGWGGSQTGGNMENKQYQPLEASSNTIFRKEQQLGLNPGQAGAELRPLCLPSCLLEAHDGAALTPLHASGAGLFLCSQ